MGKCESRIETAPLAARTGLFLSLLSTLVVSCGTPVAVKQLSAEQVRTQEAFATSLKGYVEVVNRFADAQVAVATAEIDRASRELRGKFVKQANNQLDKDEPPAAVLANLAQTIQTDTTTSQEQKKQIETLVEKLKAKGRELADAYAVMLQAQKKLDEYIQLEKADEALFTELLGIIGAKKEKITSLVTDLSGITDQILKLTTKKESTTEGAPQ